MRGVIWLPSLLLLAATLALAQGIDGTLTGHAPRAGLTLFDEIQSAPERAAFREVWDTREPIRQKELGLRFVDRYPGSIVLREAYELIARACIAIGDDAAGLTWAERSLRLMPENPFLLVMVADVAARQKQLDRAENSAQDALAYLANAETPAPLTPAQWPAVRDDLRASAHFVLGRAAAMRGGYPEAEKSLLDSLRLRPDDSLTLYVLGLARAELKDDAGAASALAGAMRASGPVAGPARQALRAIYDRSPQRSAFGFNDYAASLKWSPPERASSASAAAVPGPPGEYAGSSACRECHVLEYESWRATGMSKMFRPYRPEDIIGDFTGAQIVSNQARAVADNGRHFIEIREGQTDRWIRYPVDYIIGSKWQQAYATRLADARLLVFPIQYSRRLASKWLNYWSIVDGPGSVRADISRFRDVPEEAVYQNTCASCHTSQLKFQSAPRAASAAFREGGVNCEMCHGPSLTHAQSMKGGSGAGRPAGDTPISFGRLSAAQSTAVCAQCHAQSAVHESLPDGATNYSDQAQPFYRTYAAHLPSNFSRTAFYRDGRYRATTFISEAFARSQCFRKGRGDVRVVSRSASGRREEQPDVAEIQGRRRSDVPPVPHRAAGSPERHTRHAAWHRGEPVRVVPHAAHHGCAAVPSAIPRDRRGSRRGDDGALRPRRESQRLFVVPSRPRYRVVDARKGF